MARHTQPASKDDTELTEVMLPGLQPNLRDAENIHPTSKDDVIIFSVFFIFFLTFFKTFSSDVGGNPK